MGHILCALCETDEFRFYKNEGSYEAVQCLHCGLVYMRERPSIEEMKELYDGQETQIDLYSHLRQRDQKCSEARKSLQFIRKHHRGGGRILEIGSAAGYFLWEARKAGFEVQGLDLTRPFVRFSESVLGVAAFEGTLRDANFPDTSFDVIYHRNVLSHLAFPVEEFAILQRLLRPGGILVFETGNVAELPAEKAGFLELPDHLYHFSEDTISKLLLKTGFLHLRTYRHMLISQLPLIRWFRNFYKQRTLRERRARPLDHHSPLELPVSRFYRRWLADFSQFMRYDFGAILPNRGRRCTLVVVAKKAAV